MFGAAHVACAAALGKTTQPKEAWLAPARRPQATKHLACIHALLQYNEIMFGHGPSACGHDQLLSQTCHRRVGPAAPTSHMRTRCAGAMLQLQRNRLSCAAAVACTSATQKVDSVGFAGAKPHHLSSKSSVPVHLASRPAFDKKGTRTRSATPTPGRRCRGMLDPR